MTRKYSKSNFVDAVKIITPDVYLEEDRAAGSQQVRYTDQIINSHLVGIEEISTANDSPIGGQSPFLHLSSIPNSVSYSSIDTPEGFSRYFIKQNKLTNLTPEQFDFRMLRPLNTKLKDYETSTAFKAFVSSTMLPMFTLNSSSLLADNSGVFNDQTTASGIHEYFITNLGWLYFLNTSGPVYDPSTLVLDSLVNTVYGGSPYNLNDAIKDYQTYVWKNYYDYTASDPASDPANPTYNTTAGFNTLNADLIPQSFASAVGTFTSGTQNLEKLKTFVDIIYSPLYIDREDDTVKKAVNEFLTTNSRLSSLEFTGPFSKYLQAVSYLLRDIDNEVESLETLLSIQECPVEFLPYLASLIGWNLYGINEVGWRHQLSNAVRLYKKRGTKAGLEEALDAVIIQNPLDTSSLITEMYESYLPNLLYYLLLTDSPLFTEDLYTPEFAEALGVGTYSVNNMDVNIRAAVDSIIQGAIEEFPHLFINRSEPFRVNILSNGKAWFGDILLHPGYEDQYITTNGVPVAIKADPNFVFNYRTPNHITQVPPWEEEKFYKSCGITSDLLDYYARKLKVFCVDQKNREAFVDYVSEYVLGIKDTDLYLGNSYVFHTSSQEYAPNHDHILTNFETSSYTALSLWNGKSSTFDMTIGAGAFSSTFFQDVSGQYTVQQVIDTLRIVDEFSPAKTIPRVRLNLTQEEHLSGVDYMCPTLHWGIKDLPPVSGTLSNTEVSGVNDRGTGYALGYDIYPAYDDSQSTVSHEFAPCFHRTGSKYSLSIPRSVVNTSATVPENISRNTNRRRNFYNTLDQKGLYDRTGWNMPSFYNGASSLVDYYPLGLIPSSFSFADGSPHNLSGVYSRDCATSASNRSYFDVPVSGAFSVRGNTGITFSSCDSYVRRDLVSPEILLFFNLEEKKKKALAYATYKHNESLLSHSTSWLNYTDSFANRMGDLSENKYQSPALDIRKTSVGSLGGVQSVYNDYNEFFGSSISFSSLPENLVEKHKHGGPNILSHVYGPIYRNADFYYDGSAALHTSSGLINRSINNPLALNLALSGSNYTSIGVVPYFFSSINQEAPYFGFPEYRTQFVLSGVNFIDSSATYGSPANEFVVYQLAEEAKSTVSTDDNYLINNKCLMIKKKSHGLPRFSIDIRGQEDTKNILIPEHDFEFSVDYLIGNQEERTFGGGGIGVILRTKVESAKGDNKVFFVWTPQQEWKMVNVNDVTNGYTSIDSLVNNYAHIFPGGETSTVALPTDCPLSLTEAPDSLLSRVNKDTFQQGVFKFHTRNLSTKPPLEYGTYLQRGGSFSVYNGRAVQVHRANINKNVLTQNYFIEVFPLPTNSDKQYALFDNIKVVDTTLREAASIPYSGDIVDLNRKRDEVESTVFYNSKGKRLDFSPVVVGSWNDVGTADLFTIATPPLPFAGNLSVWNTLPKDNTLFRRWVLENNLQIFTKKFLQNYPIAGEGSLWSEDDAPWGRIPFTGLVNKTWTSTSTGFGNAQTTPGYSGNTLTLNSKRALLSRYWEQRKGFLSFGDWSDYISVGERAEGFSEQDLGPGAYGGGDNGVCWWFQGDDPVILPAGDRTPIKPLLGVSRSGHDYKEQNVGSVAVANPFARIPVEENIPTEILNGVPGVVSVGATQEADFTSYRRTDSGVFHNVDPLLPTIVDPLGYVTSATAFKNLININLEKSPTSDRFSWLTSGVWVDKGHAITFPPMSIYRDIERAKLIHGKEYTFAIHVASPGSYISQENYAGKIGFATSAILTLAPIGSAESYTRLTLRLPRDGTDTDSAVASSLQVNGHPLTGGAAARVTVSSVNPEGGYPTTKSDNLLWYRMEVTLPYDSFELDTANKPNLGLRCTLQAYNDYWDGALGLDGQPPNLSFEYYPCRLWTWGPTLHAEASATPFTRYPSTVYGVSRVNGGHWGAWADSYATADTIIYNSINNILEEETVFPREVYKKDDELYMYNKEASGLSKLTVAHDVAKNTRFASKLYKKVQLLDSSGNLYDGNLTLSPDEYLIREKYGAEEVSELGRRLTVSGTQEGSNILKRATGKILLEPRELLHLFQYFNKLGKQCAGPAINTRVYQDSSGIMDVSGGSRLSYRVNPDNPNICLDGINTTFKNYTKIDVRDGE